MCFQVSLLIAHVVRLFPVLIIPPFRVQPFRAQPGITGVDIVVCPNEETLFIESLTHVFSLLFDELSVPLSRLPPPPARRGYLVRRPQAGEDVDERVCGIPFDFLSPLQRRAVGGCQRCLIPA